MEYEEFERFRVADQRRHRWSVHLLALRGQAGLVGSS